MDEIGEIGGAEKKLTPEIIANFQNYIYKGGMLIKERRFKEAMNYFKNDDELTKVGRQLAPAREMFIQNIPKPEEYRKLADMVAQNSWNKKGGNIELSNIRLFLNGPDGLPREPHQNLPEELLHEISLIYMEEWLHSLQDLRGKPLTGHTDHEIDVALYMERNKVPLTSAFKSRYKRNLALENKSP